MFRQFVTVNTKIYSAVRAISQKVIRERIYRIYCIGDRQIYYKSLFRQIYDLR